jgi:hypothetical protein
MTPTGKRFRMAPKPRRKADLVKHLTMEHRDIIKRPIKATHWTVEALKDLHDDIHRRFP